MEKERDSLDELIAELTGSQTKPAESPKAQEQAPQTSVAAAPEAEAPQGKAASTPKPERERKEPSAKAKSPRRMTGDDNPHRRHRERVCQEYLKHGLDHFPPHKTLEMLLFFATPRQDTNPTAHRLLERFGSFSGVLNADYQLLRDAGLGHQQALLIRTVSDVSRVYMDDQAVLDIKNVIKTPEEAKAFMRYKFVGRTDECIIMACMGTNGKVLYCDKLAEGTPETVSIIPADLARTVVMAKGVSVVLAHNHPNGLCLPSNADVVATRQLYEGLQSVAVKLLDHVIVAPDGVCSMAERGLLPGRQGITL